jgi:DNA repair protein RadC/uncharacterized protein YdcH (DUF465 family)
MPVGLTPDEKEKLKKGLVKYASTGASKDDLRKFRDAFISGLKKKGGGQPVSGSPQEQPTKPSAPSFGQKVMTETLVSGEPVMKGVKKEPQKKQQDITFRREEMPSETTQAQIPQPIKTVKEVEKKAEQGKFIQSPVASVSKEKGTDFTSEDAIKKVNQAAFEKSQKALEDQGVNILSKEDIDKKIANEYEAQFGEEIDSYMNNAGNKSDKFFPYFTVAPTDLTDLQIALGEREVPNGTTIEKEGKRGEMVSALMDDYFDYMKKTRPEIGEAEFNKYSQLKSSTDRSAKNEEWLNSMETRAIQLKMAAIKRNYDKQKSGINEYSKIEASIDSRLFDAGVIALNQERAAIDAEYKRLEQKAKESFASWNQRDAEFNKAIQDLNAKSSTMKREDYEAEFNRISQEYKDEYNAYKANYPDFSKLQERSNKLQSDYEDLKVRSRMTDENVAKLEQAKTAYNSLGQSTLSLKVLGALNQDNINYYSEYKTLKDRIEKEQEAGKQRWDNASPMMKMIYAPGELANTFAAGIGNMAINVLEIPKILEDLVTGNTEYNFLDEIYDGLENYRMEKRVDFPTIESESNIQYLTSLGGNALASLATFALGGTFAGASKMAQYGATFATSWLVTEADAYEEAINTHKMSPRQAAAASTATAIAVSLAEGLIPDVKYFEPSVFRKSVLNDLANGKSLSQAFRDSFAESSASYLKSGLKEAGEEVTQQKVDNATKEIINYLGETEYFKDLNSGRGYKDAALSGLIGGKAGNFFRRPVGASNFAEDVMLEAAENADGIIAASTNSADVAKVKQDLKGPREDFQALSAHPNWKNLPRPKQARAFGITQQIRTLEEGGLKDPITNAQIEKLKNEREEILMLGENGIDAKSVGTSTTPQRVKVGDEYASFFINEDGDYEIEYNNGRSVIIEKGEGVAEKIREMGIETDEGIVGEMNIENQNTLITPTLEKGATINYAGKNATLNNYAEKNGKIVSVNITTEDGRTLQIREGQQGNSKQLLENLNSLKYDKENQIRVSGEVGVGQEPVEAKPVEAPSKEEAPASGVLQAQEEVVPEIAPEEVEANMKPITDEMANVEMEFGNNGYSIDWDYDNEIIITDNKTGEIVDAEELPEKLLPLAAQYEKATAGLAGYDFESYRKSLDQSRKDVGGIETEFEEVKPAALPEKTEPAKPSRKERLAGLFKGEEKAEPKKQRDKIEYVANKFRDKVKDLIGNAKGALSRNEVNIFQKEIESLEKKAIQEGNFSFDEKRGNPNYEKVDGKEQKVNTYEADGYTVKYESTPSSSFVDVTTPNGETIRLIDRKYKNQSNQEVVFFPGAKATEEKPTRKGKIASLFEAEEKPTETKPVQATVEKEETAPSAAATVEDKKFKSADQFKVGQIIKGENDWAPHYQVLGPGKKGFTRVKNLTENAMQGRIEEFANVYEGFEAVPPLNYEKSYGLFKQMFDYYNTFSKNNPDALVGDGYEYAANKMVEEQGITREVADFLEYEIQYMGEGFVDSIEKFKSYRASSSFAFRIDSMLNRTSEKDGKRLSNFGKGDIVYRNYNGRYEEYTIEDTSKSVWKLVSPDGRTSDWNPENNEGFLPKDFAPEVEEEDVAEVTPEETVTEEAPVEEGPSVNEQVNELITKKNRYNKIPKSRKPMGGNLLNQIKDEAERLGFAVVNVKGGNISLTSKENGKVVARRDVDRKFNKERNDKLKEAKSMAQDSLLGLRASVLLYFMRGGKVMTSQSELAGKDEIAAAKRAGFISDNGRSVDLIALEDLPELGGIVFDEQDAINEVLDVLASFENKSQMEDELIEMRDKLTNDMDEAARYEYESQMRDAIRNNDLGNLSEDELVEYYESLSEDEKVKTIEDYEKFYQEVEREQPEQGRQGGYGISPLEGTTQEAQEQKVGYEGQNVKEAVGYRGLPGEYVQDYNGVQYFAENEKYAGVFGKNIIKANISKNKVLDLAKWNKKLKDAGIPDNGMGQPFLTIDQSMFDEDRNFTTRGREGTFGKMKRAIGLEEFNKFKEEFDSADVIYGEDAGNAGEMVYAVRNPKAIKVQEQEVGYGSPLSSIEETAKALEGLDVEPLFEKTKSTKYFRGQPVEELPKKDIFISPNEIIGKMYTKGKGVLKELSLKTSNLFDIDTVVTKDLNDRLIDAWRKSSSTRTSIIPKEVLNGAYVGKTYPQELKENEQFRRALEGMGYDGLLNNFTRLKLPSQRQEVIVFDQSNLSDINANLISELYHKAKKDGSNPELVKAVENLIENKKITDGPNEGLTRTDTAAGPFVSETGNMPYSERGGVRGQGVREGGVGNTVKAVWNKYKQIKFNGSVKVKDAEDVAHIMRKLEDKAVEHAFAVHVDKNGKAHIQFLGMGGPTSTIVDPRLVLAGAKKFKSKKVYLVHNHPSGSLVASRPDIQLTNRVDNVLSPLGIELEHVIMDTYKKQYVHLYPDDISFVKNRDITKESIEEYNKALKVEMMDEQEILSGPMGSISNSMDVSQFLMQLRFTALPKHGMLLLNNRNEIIGNYIFKKAFDYNETTSFIAEAGIGTGIIFYSNQDQFSSGFKRMMNALESADVKVLDYVIINSDSEGVKGYYESYADQGKLNETQAEYGTNSIPNELREPTPRTNAEIQSLMENAADAVEQAIASGTDPQTAVNNIVSSQDWYNGLTSKLKEQFDEILQDEFGATPKAQPKVESKTETPKAEKPSGVKASISELVDNYYKLKDKTPGARDAIDEILGRDPKLKYIYDNIPKINKRLQEAGVITNKTDGCP